MFTDEQRGTHLGCRSFKDAMESKFFNSMVKSAGDIHKYTHHNLLIDEFKEKAYACRNNCISFLNHILNMEESTFSYPKIIENLEMLTKKISEFNTYMSNNGWLIEIEIKKEAKDGKWDDIEKAYRTFTVDLKSATTYVSDTLEPYIKRKKELFTKSITSESGTNKVPAR